MRNLSHKIASVGFILPTKQLPVAVMPAEAGIQRDRRLDSGVRRNDGLERIRTVRGTSENVPPFELLHYENSPR